MAKGKTKELIDFANVICDEGFTTYDDFETGLLTYADLMERIDGLKALASRLGSASDRLAAKLSEHAEANPEQVFDAGLVEVKHGQYRGVVTVDEERRFIYTRSNTEIKRSSGDNMTQEFLKELPKKWTGSDLKLVRRNLENVSDEELFEHKLVRTVKRSWRKE